MNIKVIIAGAFLTLISLNTNAKFDGQSAINNDYRGFGQSISENTSNASEDVSDVFVEVYVSPVTQLYLQEGGGLKLCIDNNCIDRYEWSISGDGATIFGSNYNYTVAPDVSGGCSGCWFVHQLNKESNTPTGWKTTLRQSNQSDLTNTKRSFSNQADRF